MGVGGSYSYSKGNGSRGRPYAMLILLAFGAALIGVLVLHKLRERRILNVLVKEKDAELVSLHLLLQEERDHNNEMERKKEELKTKIFTLRTQKMELDRRLIEMQSTIDSLRDEQKTLEAAFEEKQNEIKMLRQKETDYARENLQVVDLTESLKRKEAELEDLRHQLESQVRLLSINTKDQLNPKENLISVEVIGENGSINNNASERKSSDFRNSENETSRKMNEIDNAVGVDKRREMVEEQTKKQGSKEDENVRYGSIAGERAIDEIPREEDLSEAAGKENSISQGGQNQDFNRTSEGGRTVQTEYSQENKGPLATGKDDNESIIKTKRWRYFAKKRRSGNRWRSLSKNRRPDDNINTNGNAAGGTRSRRFFKEDQDGSRDLITVDHQIDVKNPMDSSSDTRLLKPHQPEDTEDSQNKDENHKEKPENFLDGDLRNESDNGAESDSFSDARNQKADNKQLEEEKENGIQQNTNGRDVREIEDSGDQGRKGEHKVPEDIKKAYFQEAQRDAEDGDLNEESISDTDDVKDEYKEETDESEF